MSWLASLRHPWRVVQRRTGSVSPQSAHPQVEIGAGAGQVAASSAGSYDSDEASTQEVTPEAAAACKSLRQGGIVQLAFLPVVNADGAIQQHPVPEGAVLLSQTCDLVLPDRLTVVAAPLVRLSGETLRQAERGGRPRYVAVPAAGDDAFADLDVIGTLHKNLFVNASVADGLGQVDVEIRRFGRRVARRFGRFPFPDEVVPWFSPLTDVVASKYDKATGEAHALEQVVEFRVEAAGEWTAPPYALTLVTIVRAGNLPELEEDQINPPPALRRWLRDPSGGLRQPPGEIANRLFAQQLALSGGTPAPTPAERYHLWLALAEAWAAKCVPRGRYKDDPAVAAAVTDGEISSEVVSDDEYSLARYRRSERLDVEHLSPPRPT